jgi:radical SAM protein with 4Fe4S-binding SPASM domain
MLKKINYNLYRFKYNHSRWLNLKTPVDVSLELMSRCTNSCGYCYFADRKNLPFKQGAMKTDLAFKILDDAESIGVHSLKLNYRGESTMHPDFEMITWYAKKLAHGSTFIDRVTNSNFNFPLEKDSVFRGLCNQTKVKVSFDSFIKEIFEEQRKGSKYEQTIANIDKFYNYPGRDNILVVQSVRTQLNKDEDLEHEIKSRWPGASVSIRDCVTGRNNSDLSSIVATDRDHSERQSCTQAHARLMIGYDGRVQVCCPDIGSKLIIGDANNMKLKDIWNSEAAISIRESLKNKSAFEKDPCKGCSSFETFKNFKKVWDS